MRYCGREDCGRKEQSAHKVRAFFSRNYVTVCVCVKLQGTKDRVDFDVPTPKTMVLIIIEESPAANLGPCKSFKCVLLGRQCDSASYYSVFKRD